MLTTFRRRLETARFDFAVRDILRAPPARPEEGGEGPHVVSMVRTEHLRMYLLAIKSFLRHVPAAAVEVLDDGSLTAEDHALLRRHVEGIAITPLASISTGPCPRGGCWERLLHILDLSGERYVVQLDSDVLTARAVPTVVEAIRLNRPFTLGTGPEFGIVTTAEAAAAMEGQDRAHTQVEAELALAHIPPGIGGRYIRGSAGFAGFGRGRATRERAEAFSVAMQARMGEHWRKWGTEQVTSNFLVASSEGGHVLPWPDHCCFEPRIRPDEVSLIHFVGSWRFDRGVYARLGRGVARELMVGAAPRVAAG